MTLVDTSIWIDHLRAGNDVLENLLGRNKVLVHPYIIGEIACGSLSNREEVIGLLHALPMAVLADDAEALELLDRHRLYGLGVGWVDVHLLASALLTGCSLWSLDKRLSRVASKIGL